MGTVSSSVTFVWYFSRWSAMSMSGQSVYIKQIVNVSWNSPEVEEWGVVTHQHLNQLDLCCFPLVMFRGIFISELGWGEAWWSGVWRLVVTFVTKSKVHCLKQSKYCGENCRTKCTRAQCHGHRTGAGWTPHITANTSTLCGSYLRRWLFLKVLSLAARKV